MAVDIRIGGVPYWNAHSYSVAEDSTPIDPSDTSGGVGQVTVVFPEPDEARNLYGQSLELTDSNQGVTAGIISGVSSVDSIATVTADSRLSLLVADRQALPFTGTLGDWFEYILGLVGVSSDYVIESSIASRSVTFPGFYGNLWDYVRKMTQAQQVEVSLASGNIVLRPLREREAVVYRDSTRSWALQATQLARKVEIAWYENEWVSGGLIYPTDGWNEDVRVFTVNAGDTVTETIALDFSLESVDQPVCVDSVDRYYEASSVYCVVGTGEGSDLPIPAAQWIADGGSLTVALEPETRNLTVTIVGGKSTQYAPYRIAMTAGPSDTYSSLRLVGTGVKTVEHLLTRYTAVDHAKITQDLGVTVKNELISTREQAHLLAPWVTGRYGSPRATMNVTTSGVNQIGVSGSYSYTTLDEFDAMHVALDDLDALDDLFDPLTLDQLDAQTKALTANDFANQAFGNVGGARYRHDHTMYRIRSVSPIDAGLISYSAEADTTLDELDAEWAGADLDDLSAEWATLNEQFNYPLRRTVA